MHGPVYVPSLPKREKGSQPQERGREAIGGENVTKNFVQIEGRETPLDSSIFGQEHMWLEVLERSWNATCSCMDVWRGIVQDSRARLEH
jgi:hypothetical protein